VLESEESTFTFKTGRDTMAVQMPSPEQMRKVAERCGLSLGDADLESYRQMFAAYVAAYNVVDAACS
jgi:hypothetical protein